MTHLQLGFTNVMELTFFLEAVVYNIQFTKVMLQETLLNGFDLQDVNISWTKNEM